MSKVKSKMSKMVITLTEDEHDAVIRAAEDCHMGDQDYARLMLLVAAGMGGIIEHAARAADGSFDLPEAMRHAKASAKSKKKGKAKR